MTQSLKTVSTTSTLGDASPARNGVDKQFNGYGIMLRTTAFLILSFLVNGCTTSRLNEPGQDIQIGSIRVDPTSTRVDGSTEMITRCSGFILSEKEVRNFLTHASRTKDDSPEKHYRILPCSATGTAIINNGKYNWVIRAGGVGEVSSGKDRYIAVCGKKCCGKVPGVC